MLKLLDLLLSILVALLFFDPVRLLAVVILCNVIKLLYGVAHTSFRPTLNWPFRPLQVTLSSRYRKIRRTHHILNTRTK